MAKACSRIRIGTSGWYYGHWAGLFYPAGLARNDWLSYYAQNFDTVEINNSFYHLPKEQSLKKWYRQAPENFVYAVKASRYITHIKKLKEPSEALERFFERMGMLAEKLGPVLYQLPPNFHKDIERLESFLGALAGYPPAVFEFRHESWFSEDTYELLKQFGAGFCIHDMPGIRSPRIITSDIVYVRFHGPTGRYAGNYSESVLKDRAEWLKDNTTKAHRIYIYFNNDADANAVRNAKQLKSQIPNLF
jgi:uncharacterized protein YecE (DUF72 family)